MKLIWVALVAIIMGLFMIPGKATASNADTQIRLLNWNVCGTSCPGMDTRERGAVVVHAVQAYDANVVTLQEVCVSQIKAYARYLGAEWRPIFKTENSISKCPGSDNRYGSGMLIKGPYSKYTYWSLGTDEGFRYWLTCVQALGSTVCTTHISAHDVALKTEQVKKIASILPQFRSRLILTGDFNKTADSVTMKHIYDHPGMEEADKYSRPTVPSTGTKIDFAFALRPDSITGGPASPNEMSDHQLLRTTVDW